MKRVSRTLLLMWLCGLCGCTTIRVDSVYNPEADFEGLHTYAWRPGPQGNLDDPRVDDERLEAWIRAAVNNELSALGFEKVENATPDFLIGYHLAIDARLEVTTINETYHNPAGIDGYRYSFGKYHPHVGATGYGPQKTVLREFEQGSLILDISDPESAELTWRGVAQAEVHENYSPEQRRKRINNAVHMILKPFPPKADH